MTKKPKSKSSKIVSAEKLIILPSSLLPSETDCWGKFDPNDSICTTQCSAQEQCLFVKSRVLRDKTLTLADEVSFRDQNDYRVVDFLLDNVGENIYSLMGEIREKFYKDLEISDYGIKKALINVSNLHFSKVKLSKNIIYLKQ